MKTAVWSTFNLNGICCGVINVVMASLADADFPNQHHQNLILNSFQQKYLMS